MGKKIQISYFFIQITLYSLNKHLFHISRFGDRTEDFRFRDKRHSSTLQSTLSKTA